MIKITTLSNKITIQGHALYSDYGKDIVCSAVSSIVITTINGIISIDKSAISYKVLDSFLEIEVKKEDDVTLKLIHNMLELLEKLSNDYPKNIQIKKGGLI